ncbi:hypothetical protein BDV93DRAFT_513612 [Ceratobasidium sp. AG-I]|nr:hypothetical protein BDV93DRAFT_513612 [Ceratobasidium sp. AG-I]
MHSQCTAVIYSHKDTSYNISLCIHNTEQSLAVNLTCVDDPRAEIRKADVDNPTECPIYCNIYSTSKPLKPVRPQLALGFSLPADFPKLQAMYITSFLLSRKWRIDKATYIVAIEVKYQVSRLVRNPNLRPKVQRQLQIVSTYSGPSPKAKLQKSKITNYPRKGSSGYMRTSENPTSHMISALLLKNHPKTYLWISGDPRETFRSSAETASTVFPAYSSSSIYILSVVSVLVPPQRYMRYEGWSMEEISDKPQQ